MSASSSSTASANGDLATPVTVLTGFLGAGKTTLLNRILRGSHGIKVGVLVNDFGAINIDARLVDAIEGQTMDLTNGCVCCTMQGDLVTSTIKMLGRSPEVDHVVVEASGVSDPVGVVQAFRTSALRERTRLSGVIAVVDAENARDPRLDPLLVEDQIRAADLVVLNKVDLVDEICRSEVHSWLRDLVPDVRVIEAVQASVPLAVILGVEAERCATDCYDRRDHSHNYVTWSYHTSQRLAYNKVRQALEALPAEILRAKGLLSLADAPNLQFVAQVVGRRVSIDVNGPWGEEEPITELVFIGIGTTISADELAYRFDACATDAIPLLPDATVRRLRERAGKSGIPALLP